MGQQNGGMMHDNGGMGRGGTVELVASNEPNQRLPIPERLQPDRVTDEALYYTVRTERGEHRFFHQGVRSETLGYNGSLLGPMIELPTGKTVYITTINQLDEPTSSIGTVSSSREPKTAGPITHSIRVSRNKSVSISTNNRARSGSTRIRWARRPSKSTLVWPDSYM